MKRPLRTCVLALCVAIPASVIAADSSAPPKPDLTLDIYAEPARLVEIGGGRRLNLRCSGPQSPTRTVLLEAGFGGDSMAWARVQPLLAAQLRVCSYDRAGYGFSDGGPLPRSVEAETADLHALVHAAQLSLPMVIVGHSLGSNIARRYDQRYPDDVAGLVLIDPPPQQVGKFSAQYQKQETEMLPQVLAAYRQCEQGARDGRLVDPPPELKQCLRGPNPLFSDKLNAAVRASKSRPEFWQTVITGSEAKATLFDDAVDPGEKHGKPVVVLTAVDAYAEAPPQIRDALQPAQEATHKALVKTSGQGKRVLVRGASHDIQIDKPATVVDAITDVISTH
ncbi:pimeloyl-ACP methyl ester carboxylesterase [Lysobacter niastensis]|uniref:Pimeloyl-ACP methyl ester carboxylesterase n=1 Tax=Lysobacter niastensis TaxID=380629 RepID=A0ABU1W6V1_9GAMM|nr:alpha/beta hydrolase [Lysobacter niastensis]MDR7133075.1 pimeloyl-ACP methyl ester carboxylesterase [Lysobacter niastensis]